jgi:hypothetical protein
MLFMDVHTRLPEGATAKDVADAHAADERTQDRYGVRYLNYWVDEQDGKVFCLVEAPDAQTAHTVHREAHGLVADEIYPVAQGVGEAMGGTGPTATMRSIEAKNFRDPDDVREFPNSRADVVEVGGMLVGRVELQPGWRWSEHVKPTARTESCQAPHTGVALSGRLHVRMDDGTEMEVGPGDAHVIRPGHDAWVVGNEPYVAFDWTGLGIWGKPQ